MSIYATQFELGVRRFGDQEFIAILAQGVPSHIDYTGPQWDFLPPPVDPEGDRLRAVVFVESGDEKGTPRCGQEYVRPLLTLSGTEYEAITFVDLMRRLEEALERKYGKTPDLIWLKPDGTQQRF